MKYVFYNEKANNGKGEESKEELLQIIGGGEVTVKSVINVDFLDFFKNLKEDDEVILVGGDGTLNNFVNSLKGYVPVQKVFIYAGGTGNDFLNDVKKDNSKFIQINDYIKELPMVKVNGLNRFFINGIGYGIDGYACEMGDKQKAVSDKPVNYTAISIKGVLFNFKRKKAHVEVDGKSYDFNDVWLAPTMKGRYYGGGMKVAPDQDRLNPNKTVSVVIYHSPSKLKALMVFPSIFKGEHVKHTEMITIITGKHVKVSFTEPCALQIDGETVLNVNEYEVNI